jgi:uncharacterized repeat protein (TIGR03847 family)
VFELEEPTRITFGTVGPVGQRLFVLQAREGDALVTLKLEKQQVAAISRHLAEMLEDLPKDPLPDDLQPVLEDFEEPDFAVGTLAIAYDSDVDRVVIITEEITGEDEEDGDRARFSCTRAQALMLAATGTQLVEAGRPPCPLCGFPLDPRGHVCPRTNGHHAPLS